MLVATLTRLAGGAPVAEAVVVVEEEASTTPALMAFRAASDNAPPLVVVLRAEASGEPFAGLKYEVMGFGGIVVDADELQGKKTGYEEEGVCEMTRGDAEE